MEPTNTIIEQQELLRLRSVILTKINSNLDQVDRSQILEGKLSSLIES